MTQKKWLRLGKRILLTSGIIFTVLLGILFIHIIQVSNRPKSGVEGWQLALLYLPSSTDSNALFEVRNILHIQKGVMHSFANVQAGTLSFAYDPRVANADSISQVLSLQTGERIARKVVSPDDIASSCPMGNGNTTYAYISSGFQKLYKLFFNH